MDAQSEEALLHQGPTPTSGRSAKAIGAIIIPSNQAEMLEHHQLRPEGGGRHHRTALDHAGTAGSAPDTVGGMQMVNNNASTVCAGLPATTTIASPNRTFGVITSTSDGGGDGFRQGDFMIDARGSTALVERELQNQSIMQMGNMVMNPVFEISRRNGWKSGSSRKRLDPELVQDDSQGRKAGRVATSATGSAARSPWPRFVRRPISFGSRPTWTGMSYAGPSGSHPHRSHVAPRVAAKRELAYLQYQIQKGINVDDSKVRLAEPPPKLRTQRLT